MITNDHRILDRALIITGQYEVTITERQLLRPFGVQCIDPPVLGIGSSAAEIETPTDIGRHDHWTLE